MYVLQGGERETGFQGFRGNSREQAPLARETGTQPRFTHAQHALGLPGWPSRGNLRLREHEKTFC
jgi:hypothetical protein